MSRRYGRKQRRAARETIAAQEAALFSARQAVLREEMRANEFEQSRDFLLEQIRLWDDEIRSLLGPYTSFAINELTYRVDHPDQIRQMPVIPPLRAVGPGNYSTEETIFYNIETMLGFMCGLEEEYLLSLRRYLTVRVQCGSDRPIGESYFAVSKEVWCQMKRDGATNPGLARFIHRIAGDLVRLLVTPPKKKQGDDLFPPPQARNRHG